MELVGFPFNHKATLGNESPCHCCGISLSEFLESVALAQPNACVLFCLMGGGFEFEHVEIYKK